ncbi:helix-turn-helix domain-containing protein [Burkholderia sp. PAMC 26561]|uniref:helix-turn-helix domain-containing protein n=1 Tax=Burkholderia sp. PAMC 26561 TaxID=1795043 RepID=UPI00076B6732|nr:XRE family transcriptional regulator [Burkholderia sp. PAMC 26561]AME28747.1 XRE family transcriptional regulator [Burkholderia sp. PAMC 26561]
MSTSIEFNPKRLTLARRRRGLTKIGLAQLLGVEVRSITAYENDEFRPDPERLHQLADRLHFPVQFFFGDDLHDISPDIVSFRSMSKMTAGQRDAALGAGAIALLLSEWINARFELPCADLPDLSQGVDPEAAAQTLRQMWGMGELPVKNMIHLLEARGIRVFSLSIDTAQLDAFSMWHVDTPFVFLNTRKSCEHSRFDAAHELGHLVLHRHAGAKGQEAEREANAFASAFLMPRASVLANAPHMATVEQLIRHKQYWTVSVAALGYRLHDIGLVSDWHYRTLCIELAQRGYRKREPDEAQRETSQVLAKVFATLRDEGITKADIATALCVHVEELNQLVFGLALTSLTSSRHARVSSEARRPDLSVVASRGEDKE